MGKQQVETDQSCCFPGVGRANYTDHVAISLPHEFAGLSRR